MTKKTEFDINKKPLHIYCLSDTHIGNPCFNQQFFEYALDEIKKDKHEKIIILNGDILEISSKNIGNSAFKQKIDVNEQLELAIDYLKPFKDNIIGVTKGNHDSARILKEFDFDITQVLAQAFDCNSVSQFKQTLTINEEPYKIFATHGKGSAPKKPHLALGKIIRETEYIDCDISFYGHIHKAHEISSVNVVDNKYRRRYFVATGSFLTYKNSYAENMGLAPVPEAFTRVDIDKDLNTKVNIFNIDEVCPELVEL